MLFYVTSAIVLLGVAYLHALAVDPADPEPYHPPYQPDHLLTLPPQDTKEGFKDVPPPPTRIDIQPEVALSSTGLASASLSHQSALLKDLREVLRRELREQRNRPIE